VQQKINIGSWTGSFVVSLLIALRASQFTGGLVFVSLLLGTATGRNQNPRAEKRGFIILSPKAEL